MRVLVTGGAGFIGGHVCAELAARPEIGHVVALDDLSTGLKSNLDGSPAELVLGSILDRALLHSLADNADAVVHLAARPSVPRSLADPVASHEVNATGTAYVLEACRRRGTPIVLASSSSVYGATPGVLRREDQATRPMSPYAASKLATESYALAWARSFELPVLVFRFFNVYGPRQRAGHAYAAVIPAFIDAALRGDSLVIHGDGGQTRDFTYVSTVAQVLTEAVLRRVTEPEPVNLAFGRSVSVAEVATRLGGLLQRPLATTHLPARVGDVRDSLADPARLLSLFPGIEPVSLEEGLARTLEWFQGQPDYQGQSSSTFSPEQRLRVSSR